MLTQAMFRTIYIATLQDCATSYQKKCRVKRSFYHDALCFSENDYFSRLFAERQNLQHQAQTLKIKGIYNNSLSIERFHSLGQ